MHRTGHQAGAGHSDYCLLLLREDLVVASKSCASLFRERHGIQIGPLASALFALLATAQWNYAQSRERSKPVDLITYNQGQFLYGTYYYPDHWPENRWEEDAQTIQDAGMNLVKTAEFAWARMEPAEGRFDFIWLDRAIEILSRHGIKVILGTPSETPPSWLYAKYPDISETDRHGYLFHSGVEPSLNYHHPGYVEAVGRIVTAEAEHYKHNPSVLGFSIGNEIGQYISYDRFTQSAFRLWCQRKYKTLGNLNRDWGMAYWAQMLTDWTQLPLPWYAVDDTRNPSLELDFRRFHSESVRDFVALQAGILKQIAPDKLLTTNGDYGLSGLVDYSRMYEPLDFVAEDVYQASARKDYTEYVHADLQSELMRAARNGQNFLVMETGAGIVLGEQALPALHDSRVGLFRCGARRRRSKLFSVPRGSLRG
jgi:beta-galactosidase